MKSYWSARAGTDNATAPHTASTPAITPRPRMIPPLNRAEKRTVRVVTDKNRDPRMPHCRHPHVVQSWDGGIARMTITPTEAPRLANRAERKVYHALVEQLQPNDLVIPGQRVTDHLKDHEVDFVVAIEGAGIVCLEVKGGEVWHDGAGWCQLRGGRHVHIEP